MDSLPHSTQTPLQNNQSLPANYIRALKPWFTKEILQQGFDILHEKNVSFFVFQRRFAGLLLNDCSPVFLQMGEKKGILPFVFRDGDCCKCGWQQGGGNCQHIAALALLCLQNQDDKLHTLADLFTNSPWNTIGKYLQEQTNMRRNITVTVQSHNDGMLFHGTSANGLTLKIVLRTETVHELADFFPNIRKALAVSKGNDWEIRLGLLGHLNEKVASQSERDFNYRGIKSKQQKYEGSLWASLARLLFLHFPTESIQVSQETNGIYTLHYTQSNERVFSLSIARDHTWELFDALSLPDIPVQIERAEQFSRVSFAKNNVAIEVKHCCRLRDGTEYTLAEIATNSYGNRYQINDTIFTLQAVPADEQLHLSQRKQLSLFAAVDNNATENKHGFTVVEKMWPISSKPISRNCIADVTSYPSPF